MKEHKKNKTNPFPPFFNQKSTIVNRQYAKRTQFWNLN